MKFFVEKHTILKSINKLNLNMQSESHAPELEVYRLSATGSCKGRQDFPMIIIIVLLVAIVLTVLLIRSQYQLIYHPRAYSGRLLLPGNGRNLEYITSHGRQVAYYLAPAREGMIPNRLWIMFGGNASLALDWLELIEKFPDQATGFLLLDYPGYGKNQGRPDPESIMESAEKALSVLALHLGVKAADLDENLMVMGHSLGAAVAALFASHHPVDKIVLLAPFTSLKDMAALLVGPLLSWGLIHDYDTRSRLVEILQRQPQPLVTIFHGALDRTIPVTMGRELAALATGIDYREIADGDHNSILATAKEEIIAVMTGQSKRGNKDQGEKR